MTGTTNLETVQRWYEQTGGEYETKEVEGLDGLVIRLAAFGSHEEAISTAMAAQRA